MYTAPCAAWHTPVFLLNSRLGRFTATGFRLGSKSPHVHPAPLLPKLRGQYAEFLDHVSLVHLRLLASPTCVGLRYGRRAAPQPAFLARRLNRSRIGRSLPSPSALRGCPPTALDGQSTRPLLRRFGVPGGSTLQDGAGMSTGCPSATPLGPRLRVRLTLR